LGRPFSGKLLNVLNGQSRERPPIWLMRQAGRYLPEYKNARAKAGSFWQLCMTPAAAAEVTLQPVQRFDLDAAIIFSDILLVPYAMGKKVTFEEGIGPRVETTHSLVELGVDAKVWLERLSPVYEALGRVASELPKEKDLIGFAGGPWTLASYMAQGEGSADQAAAKLWAYRNGKEFCELLGMIAECVSAHLVAQIEAGATVVQLFDSWAGGLSEALFRECVVAPSHHVIEQVRKKIPRAKIIGFPRGATQQGYLEYLEATHVDAVSLDTAVPVSWAVEHLGSEATLQGNLDPLVLMAGGVALRNAVGRLLDDTRGRRHIVNLGHGVLPDTPVENVSELVRLVRGTA
jgi:uroporphyrinogen decarboxylase